ncbi:MAG: type II toxin-antitoxin system VapC family toxin [Gemmataceae bacterium]
MTATVVDSSVAMKWFVFEQFSHQAVLLQTRGGTLHAPDFLDIELAAITWKKIRRNELSQADANFIITQLTTLPVTRHPTGPLIEPAFHIADLSHRTVYDCLYLALAVQLDGVMVTADEKLVNGLRGTAWANRLLLLSNVV